MTYISAETSYANDWPILAGHKRVLRRNEVRTTSSLRLVVRRLLLPELKHVRGAGANGTCWLAERAR